MNPTITFGTSTIKVLWKETARNIFLLLVAFILIFANVDAQTLSVVMDPANPSTTDIYPKGLPISPEDWSLNNYNVELYITPNEGAELFAVNCVFVWHPAYFSFVSLEKGTMSEDAFFYTQQSGSTCTIQTSTHGDTNYVTKTGDYIAKIVLRVLKPGTTPLTFSTVDVRDVDNQKLSFSSPPSRSNILLGDIAAYHFPELDSSCGDGEINFGDLTTFGLSYFSTYSDALYRMKCDLGPTTDGSINTLPIVDGAVNFPDLVVFSLMYGRTSLPKLSLTRNTVPYVVVNVAETANINIRESSELQRQQINLKLTTPLSDVRAMEFFVKGNFSQAESIFAKAIGTLEQYSGQVFIAVKAQSDGIIVDIGMMGKGGELDGNVCSLEMFVSGDGNAYKVTLLHARNSLNKDLVKNPNSEEPSQLRLYQNYPNPFNPSTSIQYYHSDAGKITIHILTMVGQEVFTRIQNDEGAGEHTFVWNGIDSKGNQAPSGIYFVSVENATTISTIKITLLR